MSFLIISVHTFRGDVTDVSAKTKTLFLTHMLGMQPVGGKCSFKPGWKTMRNESQIKPYAEREAARQKHVCSNLLMSTCSNIMTSDFVFKVESNNNGIL